MNGLPLRYLLALLLLLVGLLLIGCGASACWRWWGRCRRRP